MKTFEDLHGIGIDVSKATLEVALLTDTNSIHIQAKNSSVGIRKLARELEKYDPAFKSTIVMESTGRYHALAAIMLSEVGFDVRVINPLLARKHIASNIRKVKTDKADAVVLAKMVRAEQHLPKRFDSNRQDVYLRNLQGWIASLETKRQAIQVAANSFKEANEKLGIQASQAEADMMQILEDFKKQIQVLQKHLETHTLKNLDTAAQAQVRILNTIPGISPYVAALLIQQMDTSCTHAKQWIAYVGIDISIRESGTWKRSGRLTKRGNPYLRKRLYSAAWGATMTQKPIHAYYTYLKQAGRNHKAALIIIARKLLTIAFTLIKHNTNYDPNKTSFNIPYKPKHSDT